MSVVIIAAVARNGVIGADGRIPWHIPEDLARFKELTMGHALIMGRATFESIGRALPGRDNIVLTGRPVWSAEGVTVARSLEEGLAKAVEAGKDAYVAGGSEVYRLAVDLADSMELTEVDAEPEGDTWFPELDWSRWEETNRVPRHGFSFVSYRRAGPAP